MTCGVYRLVNPQNGKFYIGQSINIEQRFTAHAISLKNGYNPNQLLQKDFSLCPFELILEIIEETTPSQIIEREKFWINHYKNLSPKLLYNITGVRKSSNDNSDNILTLSEAATLCGFGPFTIRHWCEEGKIKARQSNKVWLIDRQSLLDFIPPRPGVKNKGKEK